MKKIINILLLLSYSSLMAQVAPPSTSELAFAKREAEATKLALQLIKQMTLQEKVLQLLNYIGNGLPRLGIPNMASGETLHGVVSDGCTSFPQSIAMAASFDTALMKQVAQIIAKEARAVGLHQTFSPMLGVARDPRWGRVEESFGEDPFLVTQMGVAYINGIQGEGANRLSNNNIIATPKHFVADGEPWAGMNGEGFETSERVLREVYFPAFEAAITQAKAQSIMPAHHTLDGIPCHANTWLLNNVLRKEWKFNGFVTSDMDDILKIANGGGYGGYKYAKDSLGACIAALKAGVDMELIGRHYKKLPLAVADGRLPEQVINQAVERVLRAKILLLGIGKSVVAASQVKDATKEAIVTYKGGDDVWAKLVAEGKFDTPESGRNPQWKQIVSQPLHDSLALKAAQKTVVLLKNQAQVLPLQVAKTQRVLVVGPIANVTNLGGYATGKPKMYVSVVQGIKELLGAKAQVSYQEGCTMPQSQRWYNNIATSAKVATEDSLLKAAVEAAQNAEVIIAVVGHTRQHLGENLDRDDLGLIGNQQKLVEAMQATGKQVVVVFNSGAPISAPWIDANIKSIVQVFYNGQFTGTAVAQVLFGVVNPGGKMPMTTARNVGQVPCYYNHPPFTGPVNYYGSKGEPIYPFGHGLSYTTFQYSNLKVVGGSINNNQPVTIQCTVENTGNVTGDEVVQLYIHQDYTSVVRPVKELKAFQRISLLPKEKKTVSFKLKQNQVKFWKKEGWTIEPGEIDVFIGSSSKDIRLKTKVINN